MYTCVCIQGRDKEITLMAAMELTPDDVAARAKPGNIAGVCMCVYIFANIHVYSCVYVCCASARMRVYIFTYVHRYLRELTPDDVAARAKL